MDQVKLAKGLGWFSIGLGLTEMLAPEWLARKIGVDEDRSTLLRAMGARETATGVFAFPFPGEPVTRNTIDSNPSVRLRYMEPPLGVESR